MKNKFLVLFVLLFSLNIFAVDSLSTGTGNYEKTLKSKIQLFNLIKNFIDSNDDLPNLDKLYFKLAELSNEINVKNPQKTLDLYRKVLEINPDFIYKDVVLYNIAFYNLESKILQRDQKRIRNLDLSENWPDSLRLSTKDLELSIKSYEEIIRDFPDSKYRQEAMYRLGELYFTISLDAENSVPLYKKSIENFNNLLATKSDSFYKPYAQFYKAWIEYVSGQNELAINDFSHLLKLLNEKKNQQLNSLFKAGSLDNFARCLLDFDKDFSSKSIAAEKANEALKSLLPENYAKEVLLKSIKYKLMYNAPQQAIDFYNTYIKMYPLSVNCPTYIDSIVHIYIKYAQYFPDSLEVKNNIIASWKRAINEYKVTSEWYKANRNKDIKPQLDFIKSCYFKIENRYYNEAVAKTDLKSVLQYKKLIDSFLEFPEFKNDETNSENIYLMNQRYADIYYTNVVKTKKYALYNNVIDLYSKLDEKYPSNPNYYLNESKIYQVAQDLYAEANSGTNQENIKLDTDSLFIAISKRFEKTITDTAFKDKYNVDEHVNILLNRGRILFKLQRYVSAQDIYNKILTLTSNKDVKKEALATLAQINYINKKFDEAEKLYDESYAMASNDEKSKYLNNKYAVIEAKAKNLDEVQEYEKSAEEYLRLRNMFSNDKLKSIGYILKAIEEYKLAKNYDKIISLYSEIARLNSLKSQVLAAYVNAWSIADSLKMYDKSEQIRYSFIKRFPKSTEALQVKLDIIKIYEEDKKDLTYAANEYYNVYKNRKKYNFGRVSPKSVLLKAIQLYTKIKDEDKQVKLSLLYAKKYPKDKLSDKMLVTVAGIYQKNNEDAKLKTLAVYMYKKNPNLNIYVNLAKKNLRENLAKAEEAYAKKNESEVNRLKSEYTKMVTEYRRNGIKNLPFSVGFKQYSVYTKNFAYIHKVDKKIAYVKKYFLNKSANALIPVNRMTRLNDHLLKGKSRIPRLSRKAKKMASDLFKLVTDSKDVDLSNQKRIEIIYYAGKINQYAADVISKQINKYLKYGTDPKLAQYKVDKATYEKVKRIVRAKARKYSIDNVKEAVKYYMPLVTNFYDDLKISNQFTEDALVALEKWKVRTPLKVIDVPIDGTWLVFKNTENLDVNSIDSRNLWEKPILNKTEQDTSLILDSNNKYLIKKMLDVPIIPKELRLITSQNIEQIMLNGKDVKIKDSHFGNNYVVSENLVSGQNSIILAVKNLSKLSLKVELKFDSKMYEKYKNTKDVRFVTDYAWRYSAKDINDINTEYDSLSFVGKDNFSFYKSQIIGMENSVAKGIWEKDFGGKAKADTIYFYKIIDIDGNVVETEANLVAEKISTLWVNNEIILKDNEILVNKITNEVQPVALRDLKLHKGRNIIKVKVISNQTNKGGLLIDIKAKIKSNEGSN